MGSAFSRKAKVRLIQCTIISYSSINFCILRCRNLRTILFVALFLFAALSSLLFIRFHSLCVYKCNLMQVNKKGAQLVQLRDVNFMSLSAISNKSLSGLFPHRQITVHFQSKRLWFLPMPQNLLSWKDCIKKESGVRNLSKIRVFIVDS